MGKIVDPFLKIFIFNKHFIVVFLTGLAITTLLTSSLALTNYYLRDVSVFSLKGLNYHILLYIAGYEKPWKLEEKYSWIINQEIVSKTYSVYVELYSIPNNIVLKIGNNPVNKPVKILGLLYIPGLNNTLLYSPQAFLEDNNIIICGCNITAGNSFYRDLLLQIGDNKFLVKYPVHKSPHKIVLDELDQAYASLIGQLTISPGEQGVNPYVKIFDEIILQGGVFTYSPGITREKQCAIIVLTGDKNYYIELSNITRKYSMSPVNIRVKNILFEAGHYFTEFKTISTGQMLISIIWFAQDKLQLGVSISTAISAIDKYVKVLRSRVLGASTGIIDSPLYLRLTSMFGAEQLFRIATALTIIPAFLMIWITSSKVPPVIISITRKTIALLRIRGISIDRIKKAFTYTLLLWVLPGSLLGLLAGPFLSNILYHGTIDLESYLLILTTVSDPLTILIVIIVSLILMIGSIISSFKVIEKIKPIEFLRPSILGELPIVEKGVSKITILLLLLGIYYVLRTTIINPYTIKPENIFMVFVQLILLILESIILLFGPIILIYSVAKLMISFPDKIGLIASKIASSIARKYHVLIARFIEVKPARIALTIVLSSFATSLLIGGFAGSDAMSNMINSIGTSVHGNTDYLIAKPIIIDQNKAIEYILGNVSSATPYIKGKYVYSYLLIGVISPQAPSRTYESVIISINRKEYSVYKNIYIKTPEEIRYVPLGYVLFITGNYTSIVDVIDNIGFDKNFVNSIKEIEKRIDSAIYVFNPAIEDKYGIPYAKTPYKGEADIYLSDKHVYTIKIIETAMNLPVIAGYRPLQGFDTYYAELTQTEIASIPIYAPMERGLIVSINNIEDYISTLKLFGHNTTFFGYVLIYVRGEITERSTLVRNGYLIISLKDIREEVINMDIYMTLSMDFTIAMGATLFLITLVIISLLSYSIVYENLYSYTLMRGRGISNKDVYLLSFAETFSISILSIMPGILLGIFLGYGLPALSSQTIGVTDIYIDTAYGITLILSMSQRSYAVLATIILLPITISWIIVYLTYRKIVREALMLIGSHI